MAILRGKGSMSGVELVVVEYPNAHSKAGDRFFLDAQVRPVEGVAPQQVPHLVSKKRELDGRTVRLAITSFRCLSVTVIRDLAFTR